ncbi:hypothetical protein Rhe02_25350 [Rhizocola hellebori]|uniref:Glycosyltransferase RgtA/B/C/D-like domain-containing protein n=1 Tax=Rhizocola hellebori TaxID=1392758 RepID=A0A8J3VG43_9ACTN|nr:hypothetical protein [Rhizocola hellebori]GIH04468.1 hypothetical protein Rhe02_25350 [Rhizocola hellebori]
MSLWRRAGGLRFAGMVVLTAVLLRALQLLLVAALTIDGERVVDRLLIWDGDWFLNVAMHGYPDGYSYDDDGVRVGNGFAFFPLFPALVRGVIALGVQPGYASLLVAGVAGLVAALLIYLLGVAIWSRPVGMMLMVLVCTQPMAVVLNMGYTESLFLALVAGTMLAAYQRLWWLAALTGVAAGLTRPTGVAVGLALAVAAFLLWRMEKAQGLPAQLAAPIIPTRSQAAAAPGAGAEPGSPGGGSGQTLAAGFSRETFTSRLSAPAASSSGRADDDDDYDDDDDDESASEARGAVAGVARGALTRGTGQWRVLGAGAPDTPSAVGRASAGPARPGGAGATLGAPSGGFGTPTGEWRALGLPGEGAVGGLLSLAAERTGSGAASKVIATRKATFAAKGRVTRAELVQAWVAAALTLLAGPVFVLWVGWRVGEWDAWFKVQTAGWGSTFDGGASVATFLLETLRGVNGMVEMVTAWLILGTFVLCLVAIVERVWVPLIVYGFVAMGLVIGQAGYWHSKPRLLVPVLLLACIPLARALAAAPRRTAIAVLALWSAFGLWFGAYMISIWPFTI